MSDRRPLPHRPQHQTQNATWVLCLGLSPWRDLLFGPTQEFESVSLRKSFIRAAIERLESANKLKFDNKEQKFLWIKDMTARLKLLLQHVSSYKWKGSKSPKWFKRLRMFGEEWETIPGRRRQGRRRWRLRHRPRRRGR